MVYKILILVQQWLCMCLGMNHRLINTLYVGFVIIISGWMWNDIINDKFSIFRMINYKDILQHHHLFYWRYRDLIQVIYFYWNLEVSL